MTVEVKYPVARLSFVGFTVRVASTAAGFKVEASNAGFVVAAG